MTYYHGTDSLDTMIKIIESGGIKSKNKRQADYDTLYNGDDYISVGKLDDVSDYTADSCFFGWIFGKPTFIISDDISVIKPEFRWGPFNPDKDRVSIFKDEYHVRDEIPLDKIEGIAIPFSLLEKDRRTLMNILKLLRLASSLNWSVYESDLDLIERVNTNNVFDGMAKNNKRNYN